MLASLSHFPFALVDPERYQWIRMRVAENYLAFLLGLGDAVSVTVANLASEEATSRCARLGCVPAVDDSDLQLESLRAYQ